MFKRLAARNRHRHLMSTAISVAGRSNPTPEQVAALAFARRRLTVDPAEATTYLEAAHAYLGHITHA